MESPSVTSRIGEAISIRWAEQTDVGKVRAANEDSHSVCGALGLFIVADGMGGHVGGKAASSLAVASITDHIAAAQAQLDAEAARIAAATAGDDLALEAQAKTPSILADAIRAGCARIYQKACDEPQLQGMGTTATAALICGQILYIAHVGDSRCYLQRGERIIQVTDDHSLVNEQMKAGLLTQEAARTSKLKNIITRSVGFEPDVAVDTFALPVAVGDRFLMCSDGLTNFVDDTEIGLALTSIPLDEVPGRMIDLANERGGDDNITVVCIAIDDAHAAIPQASPPTSDSTPNQDQP